MDEDAPSGTETAAEREREERRDEDRELLSRYAREQRSGRGAAEFRQMTMEDLCRP